MSVDEREWIYERKRLEDVIIQIKKQIDKNIKIRNGYKNEGITMQKAMAEEINLTPADMDDVISVWQYQTDIDSIGRLFKFSDSRVKKLEKMMLSPYFGRIDFLEDGQDNIEKIYIGLSSLVKEPDGGHLVYDWRAPISSLFYDYETGRVMYNCPAGVISGEMPLKRQYRIKNGILEYMFDSSLKIDDEILQEILSKSADSRMKTIVTTIQREQNKVIRDEAHRLLIVQGPAGSGKTSIALHRIAYLLYRYRDSISSENIVIFSPNKIFSDYISNVLPELGEENISRMTFGDLALKVFGSTVKLENANEFMEYIFSTRNKPGYAARIKNIKYKTSREFTGVLGDYAKYLQKDGVEFCDIFFNGKKLFSKEEISALYRNDYAYLPVFKRLQKIRQRLIFLLEPLEEARIEEVKKELADTGKYIDKGEIKVRSTLIVRGEFASVKESIDKITQISLLEVYVKLFSDRELFLKISGGNIPDGFDQISSDTVDNIQLNRINHEDVAPLLFLNGALGDLPDTSAVKYVVVDEMQDYTPLQFEILRLLYAESSLTMLGDLNQSINPYANIKSYKAITDILDIPDTAAINLTRSYRSTGEITAFCRALLPDEKWWDYIPRKGSKPEIIKAAGGGEPYDTIIKSIKHLRDSGFNSVAVICKTAHECLRAYEHIKRETGARLVTGDDTEFSAGVVVIPSYLSKGLEFDAVLVLCTEDGNYCHGDERKLFYTVCTRALHVLKIYYTDILPVFINNVDPGLYKTPPKPPDSVGGG